MRTTNQNKAIIRLTALLALIPAFYLFSGHVGLINDHPSTGTIKSVNPDTDPEWLKQSSVQRKKVTVSNKDITPVAYCAKGTAQKLLNFAGQ